MALALVSHFLFLLIRLTLYPEDCLEGVFDDFSGIIFSSSLYNMYYGYLLEMPLNMRMPKMTFYPFSKAYLLTSLC